MKEKHKIGIKDIAGLAGVSIGTVDRVIHERGEVSEATRTKILKIIKEYHFEPDILASTLASKKGYRFVTLIPESNPESLFWSGPQYGIKKAADEISHYSVLVKNFTFDQFDRKNFQRSIDDLIDFQPDAVLFAPVFYEESLELIKKLEKESIPFAFVNSNINHPKSLSYIGQDSKQSGYVAAKLMSFLVPAGSDILIINISKAIENHKHILKRQKGFKQFFHDQKQNRHTLEVLNINDMSEKNNSAIFNNMFAENKKIKGIFVTNSKVYKICKMLAKEQIKDVKVIGYDLLDENIYYLKKGLIDFLISQKPVEQGYNGIMTLFNHMVLKRPVKNKQYLPIDIITKENIQYYLEN